MTNKILGERIFDMDWDNLIILDGCRYDDFSELSDIDGDLTYCRSSGSSTPEFVQNNYADESYPDTVYISANPHVARLAPSSFHKILSVWETHWDTELGTVKPGDLTDVAKRISKKYGNKRLIIHYMQPHHPFIAQNQDSNDLTGNQHAKELAETGSITTEHTTVWEKVRKGEINVKKARVAYRQNLEMVLREIDDIMESLVGKTVITSDHGNLFGEKPFKHQLFGGNEYSHPSGCTAPELVKVPWLILPHNDRKVVEGKRSEEIDINNKKVSERLESLGYK
jgi:hypothetical protein